VLQGGDTEELVREWIDDVAEEEVRMALTDELAPAEWDWDELALRMGQIYPTRLTRDEVFVRGTNTNEVADRFAAEAQEKYSARAEEFGAALLRRLERTVVLSIVDTKWRENLAEMDYLRSGIGLRAMGQRDPLTEYQREAYDMFSDMVSSIKRDSVRYLFHAQVVEQPRQVDPVVRLQGTGGAALKRQASAKDKVGRNEPCPCGSGKKYKRCHGAATGTASASS
jgi:preprotein translocase subunit SecA